MATYEEIDEINASLQEDEDTQKDKYLTFRIADEDYAIEIRYVNEIIGIQKATSVPMLKSYIKGIINLRGIIVPVIEVRNRFRMESIEYNERTCIVVITVGNVSVGLIVDEVEEVMNIPEGAISPPPQTNKGSHSRYIQGIGRVGEVVKIILDIQKLLYDEHEMKKENAE